MCQFGLLYKNNQKSKEQKVCEDFEDLKYDEDRFLTPIRSTIECAEWLLNEIQGKSLEEPIIVEDYYFNTKHIKCIESLRHTVMSKVMSYVKTRDVCYLKFFIAFAKS